MPRDVEIGEGAMRLYVYVGAVVVALSALPYPAGVGAIPCNLEALAQGHAAAYQKFSALIGRPEDPETAPSARATYYAFVALAQCRLFWQHIVPARQ